MTASDSYDIFVDADGWPSTRAALADVVAGATGLPVPRVRSVLDVPGSPVATLTTRAAAERVAESLREAGVSAQVRRHTGRRSLEELTSRVSAPTPEGGRADGATESGAMAKTQRPGWNAFGGPKTPPATTLGTMVGLPSWGDDLQRTLSGTPDPVVAARRRAKDEPEAAPGPTSEAIGRRVDELADVERPPAGTSDDGWAGILGEALAERLVGDSEPEKSVAGNSPAPPIATPPAPVVSPPAPDVSSAAAGPPVEASADDGLGDTFVAPAGGETFDLRNVERVRRAALAAADTSEPTAVEPEPAATIEQAPEASVPPASETSALETSTGSSGRNEPSAWARAGVNVEGVREAAPAVDVSVRPQAPIVPAHDDDMARGETFVFDAGMAKALGDARDEPSEPAMSVGDRFVRLRQPENPAVVGPTPEGAALWGLIAPGGGFAYLGDTGRGLTYALGSFLIVPWIKGMLDASHEAAEIRDGRRLLGRRPSPYGHVTYAVSYWLAVLVLVGGVVALRVSLDRRDRASETPSITTDAEPVDTGSASGFTGPPSGEDLPSAEPDAESVDDIQERTRRLERLLQQARGACDAGRFFECRQYAEEALSIDERNRDATLLHVRAVTQGVVTPPPDEQVEPGNDRQPDRPPAQR